MPSLTYAPISVLSIPATALPMLNRPLLRMFMATCGERRAQRGPLPPCPAGRAEGPRGLKGTDRNRAWLLLPDNRQHADGVNHPANPPWAGREHSTKASKPGHLPRRCSHKHPCRHPPSKKKKEMGHAYSKGSGHFPQPQGRGAETKTGWVPAANSSLSQQRVSVRVLLSQKKSRRFQVVTSHRQSKHPPDVHPALSQPLART